MKFPRSEIIVGVVTLALLIAGFAFFTGAKGLTYLGIAIIVASVAAWLLQRRSLYSKLLGVAVFPHAVVNFLRPRHVTLQIKSLEEREKHSSK